MERHKLKALTLPALSGTGTWQLARIDHTKRPSVRALSLVRIDLPHMHAIIYPIIIEKHVSHSHASWIIRLFLSCTCMLLQVQTSYFACSDQNIGGSE